MRLRHADGSEEIGPRKFHNCEHCGFEMPIDQHAHPCSVDIDEAEAEAAMQNQAAATSSLTEGDL